MAPRTLKETTSRKKSCEFVESAVDVHGDEISALLAEKLGGHLEEGEEMPDFRLFLTLVGRRLGVFRGAMEDAAEAHANELANDDEMRTLRAEATAALSRDYVAVRSIFYETFGPEKAWKLGFEAEVARQPVRLELQVRRLVSNLSHPELVLPEPRLDGVSLSIPEQVEIFRPNLEKLRAARKSLDGEHRKADRTLLTKSEKVATYDQEFLSLSRCLEAAFALAGEKELAARVRPSVRRLGRRQEVEDGPEPQETEPPAGDSEPAEPAEPPPEEASADATAGPAGS